MFLARLDRIIYVLMRESRHSYQVEPQRDFLFKEPEWRFSFGSSEK
jgi:hypothetical protein